MNQGMNVSGRGGVVAGLFHGTGDGDRALVDLKAAGFTRVEISQVDGKDSDAVPASSEAPRTQIADADVASIAPFFQEHDSSASSFVDELIRLGFSKHDAHDLVDGLVKGEALVTADAGADLDRAVAILTRHSADIRYTSGPARPTAATATTTAAATDVSDADREIQLRAERLVVNKQRVQHGEARIRKEIVTEIKSVDVPVTHEELVIERHAVTDSGAIDNEPIAEETIRIPLTEEKVTFSKETVVREEVEVGTRRVEDVARVTDTLRHEELHVEDATTTSSAQPIPPKAK